VNNNYNSNTVIKHDDKRTVNNNYNSNTVIKQDFAVVKQVDGQVAHMTDTTRHQSISPPLYQNMLNPSLSEIE
jgi:hypothetical protein